MPKLNLIYATLSSTLVDLEDKNMKSDIELRISQIKDLTMFDDSILLEFLSIKQIMALEKKTTSQREIFINMNKPPVPYPKDQNNKIKNAYFGLIKVDQLIKILSEDVGSRKVLRKGIFDDNIRDYLGSSEKIEVNIEMKNQLLGDDYHLFGLLNNGITIISDEIRLNSDDLSLVNYQIVNGCQTSNIIFEFLEQLTDYIYTH